MDGFQDLIQSTDRLFDAGNGGKSHSQSAELPGDTSQIMRKADNTLLVTSPARVGAAAMRMSPSVNNTTTPKIPGISEMPNPTPLTIEIMTPK